MGLMKTVNSTWRLVLVELRTRLAVKSSENTTLRDHIAVLERKLERVSVSLGPVNYTQTVFLKFYPAQFDI
jgi:hypothetical protein